MFTYPNSALGGTMTSVIERDHAERLADLFEAKGISSPFASDWNGPKDEAGNRLMAYQVHPEIVAAVAELPDRWKSDVHYVLDQREKVRRVENIRAKQGEIAHEGIRAYLLGLDQFACFNFLRTPETRDLSDLAKLATRADLGNGKPVYSPLEGCKARLKLKEAVAFWYEQASYADHTRYAVPVEIEAGADMSICHQNLGRFCSALRTHTGFAGSGCTWTAELISAEAGSFVILDCRASISD